MNEKTVKLLNQITLMLIGFGMIIFGVVLMLYSEHIFRFLSSILIITYIFVFFYQCFSLLDVKKRTKKKMFQIVLSIAIILALSINRKLPFELLLIIIGVYELICGAADIVQFDLDRRNDVTPRFLKGTRGFVLIVMSLVLITTPIFGLTNGVNVLGIYFIIDGLYKVVEALFSWLPNSKLNRFKGRVRVKPPVFFEAVVPKFFLMEINKTLEPVNVEGEEPKTPEKLNQVVLFDNPNEDKLKEIHDQCEVEVLIHVSDKSFGQVGHMDVAIDGIVRSYGCYDFDTFILGGLIGDGVYFEANKDKYISFCQWYSGKTIFSFCIRITTEQKTKILNQIQDIFEESYAWQTKYESGIPFENIRHEDYASYLVRFAGAKMRKFRHGKYKKYFGLITNCVMLGDRLLGPTGSNIFSNNGILTPGTYLNFLANEVKKPNSQVVSYRVYR